MSLRGDKTKQEIRDAAYRLFEEKGFKEVTMKDICEQTGLSRGGLYRHYESTEQIFLEIVNAFSDQQKDEVFAYQGVRMYSRLMEIERNIPVQITNEIRMLLLAEEV